MAHNVIPHEPGVRQWLRHARAADDADDLIQEAYYRMSALESIDHIEQPGAYFFSLVRNLLVRRLRQGPLVQLDAIAEVEAIPDPGPGLEREVGARLDYARIKALLAALPERDRRIIEMRKVDGISQREIAARLGITESIVENVVHRGLRAVLRAWEGIDAKAGKLKTGFGGKQRA